MCEDSKAWGAITTGWGQRERTPPRPRARAAAGRRRSSRRRTVLSPAGSRGLLFSSVPRKSHFHRDRFAVSGTLIRKINYLHPASLLFFDSVRSVGLRQGFLFKGEQVGFLRVGRAAFRAGRPLAAVGGQGKRGRSGRRPGAADRSEAKQDCPGRWQGRSRAEGWRPPVTPWRRALLWRTRLTQRGKTRRTGRRLRKPHPPRPGALCL